MASSNENYGDLADVGNCLKLREEIDQNQRATNFIRSSLAVVDIIPCGYVLSLGGLKDSNWAIKYDLQSAIKDYKELCGLYDLDGKSGVRLWLTDDTVASDEISNQYEANIFETMINKASGFSKPFNFVKSAMDSASPGSAEDAINTIIKETGSDKVVDDSSNLMKSAADILLLGKRVGLPRIWSSSSYHPSLTLTAKLVSPYGDPKAIRKYIIEPLVYILLLASPKSSDGISYGLTRPVRVQAYGLTYLSVASIDSINIRRGGREVAHNIHKQPLVLDIFMTMKPLIEGFAAMIKKKDIVTVKDSESPFNDPPEEGPGITTIGNIIQSLRPAPTVITDPIKAAYPSSIPPPPGSTGSSSNSSPNNSSNVTDAISYARH